MISPLRASCKELTRRQPLVVSRVRDVQKRVLFESAGYRLTWLQRNHGVIFGRHMLENKSHEFTAVAVIDARSGIYVLIVLIIRLHKIIDDELGLLRLNAREGYRTRVPCEQSYH